METINNLTSAASKAASKAIWGEGQSHEEPVSGKMGNVAAGEPYDAGNIEPNKAALETPGKKDTETPNEPAIVTRTTGRTVPEPMPKPDPEAATKPRFVEAKPALFETTEKVNTNQPANPSGPAGSAPSAVGMRDDSTKAQNDTRPPPEGPSASTARTPATNTIGTGTPAASTATTGSTPATIPGTAAAPSEADTKITTPSTTIGKPNEQQQQQQHHQPQTKKDTLPKPSDETVTSSTSTPDVNLTGPGPRPLEEIAREHGGDAAAARRGGGEGGGLAAAAATPAPAAGGATSGATAGGAAGTGAAVPAAGADVDAVGREQHQNQRRRDSGKGIAEDEGAAGMGDEYVKSSGLRADGGDFDASRPGAGREADRLLEEKGVHPPAGTHRGNDVSSRSGGGHDTHGSHAGHGAENGKEKLGLKDKIKAKLHKGSTSS